MAHFDNLNQHRRRVHNLGARAKPDSSLTTSTTSQSLIIPVAPTIIVGKPTSTSSVLSPSPVQSSPASSPQLTPSSLSTSSILTTTSTTLTSSSSTPVLATPTTTPVTHTSSTPTTTRTLVQTVVNPSSLGLTSSVSPSPTSSSTSNGTSSGIIIGGVIAAILGTAGILAAVVYFLRKCRGREDEAFAEEIWNRNDARRQSAVLRDESESVRGYDAPPRPPSMIERHMHNQSPRQPNLPNIYPYNAYGAGHGAPNHSPHSFSPGQVVTPTSANPFFSPYAQDVMGSPVSSTIPEYHDPPRSGDPAFPPQALAREPSIGMDQVAVARQNSVTGGPFNPVVSSPDAADPHYTDLSRSSVTPFQAAQYAEITEKLGAPMSSVLSAVPEEPQAVMSGNMASSTEAEDTYTESPFTDAVAVQQPIGDGLDDELPLPSPYAFQQTRIASLPPTLPEISVPERSFSPVASLEFPVPLSVRNSPSPISAEFSDLRGPPPTLATYKSSPLAASTPMQAQAQATVIPREPKSEAAPAARPDTVYTVYDEEDAYGGM